MSLLSHVRGTPRRVRQSDDMIGGPTGLQEQAKGVPRSSNNTTTDEVLLQSNRLLNGTNETFLRLTLRQPQRLP